MVWWYGTTYDTYGVVWRAVCVKVEPHERERILLPARVKHIKDNVTLFVVVGRCVGTTSLSSFAASHMVVCYWYHMVHTTTTPYGMVPTGLCNELHPHQYSTAQYANNSPEDPFESNQPKEVGRVSEKSPHLRRANYRRQAPFRDTRNCNL